MIPDDGLKTEDYMEYAHHLREAGRTVVADVIDALVAQRVALSSSFAQF